MHNQILPSYKKLPLFLFTIILFLIAGCGFHLGHQQLPPKLKVIYFASENPYEQFAIDLKQTLKYNGAIITDDPKKASSVLRLISTDFTHTGAGIYSSSQANIYNFYLNALFQVESTSGKVIFGPRSVSVSRTLSLSPNEVLEASNQVRTLEREMNREAIIKTLNILNAKQLR